MTVADLKKISKRGRGCSAEHNKLKLWVKDHICPVQHTYMGDNLWEFGFPYMVGNHIHPDKEYTAWCEWKRAMAAKNRYELCRTAKSRGEL